MRQPDQHRQRRPQLAESDIRTSPSPLLTHAGGHSIAQRRATLRGLLAGAGALAAGPAMLIEALAADPRTGMRSLQGDVRIDGQPAQPGQQLASGQLLETGPGAQAVFVIGDNVFLQRENSGFSTENSAGVLVLRYLSGKVLSVFGPGRKQLETPTATIGIRGTGCYIEAEPERTYFCLCYGRALLIPKGDPNRRKSLRTRHHEFPVYIDRSAGASAVLPAHVVNHTDDELIMLEALVGRRPPFLGRDQGAKKY